MKIGLAGVGRIGAFHAETLAGIGAVDALVVADLDSKRAAEVATERGVQAVTGIEELFDADIDGLVIATATPGHAPLLRAAVARGIPTFCEKPVAATLAETIELAELVDTAKTPVQVGFQRRFDAGYRAAKAAVDSGELGTIHALRLMTHDQAPPHPAYIPTSGGLFRDCSVHDFDILRFTTGLEVATVYATGANKGADFFAEAGDVDTAAAILTLTDGTLVSTTATRYSGGGHDVRMEVMGADGSVAVGLDDSLALRSVEDGVDFPAGPPHWSFMERFTQAYRAELTAFCELVAGQGSSACTVRDALEAFRIAEAAELSRAQGQPVVMDDVPSAPAPSSATKANA